MFLVSHSRQDLADAGANFFRHEGIQCAVAEADSGYLGFVILGEDDEVFQVASGEGRIWVESTVARTAETMYVPDREPRHSMSMGI
jgi:hypothetical protein